MSVRALFSETDLDGIRAATREAESKSGAEVVCVVVGRCDPYGVAIWKGAALGAVLAAVIAGAIHHWSGWWSGPFIAWTTLPACLGAAAGAIITLIPVARRCLAAPDRIERRVLGRAAVAFVDEEVFATTGRTGVMLFVAIFEHRVVVVADTGLADRLPANGWTSITDRVAAGIRAGRAGAAVVEAIDAIGAQLAHERPPSDDRDELSNEPRLHDA